MKNIFLILVTVLISFAFISFASNYPIYTLEDAPIRKEFSVLEGQTLNFDIVSFDPDGDAVSIEVLSALPEGMILGDTIYREEFLDDSLPEVTEDSAPAWYTKSVEWTPNFQQEGEYILEIRAEDEFGAENFIRYKIIVVGANRPPVL